MHRSVPGIHRVLKLRRIAGLGPPFSLIPKKQPRYRRYARLCAKIIAEEMRLRTCLRSILGDLERRAARNAP